MIMKRQQEKDRPLAAERGVYNEHYETIPKCSFPE